MSKIYMVEGGSSGRCRCGHRSREGEVYVLIEGVKGSWTLCKKCGEEKGLKGERIDAERLRRIWFKGETLEEVLRKQVPTLIGVGRWIYRTETTVLNN